MGEVPGGLHMKLIPQRENELLASFQKMRVRKLFFSPNKY